MIHENSLAAYKEIQPTLTEREKAVYKVLFLYGELTAWEVSIKMGVTPNQISGRFRPLEDKGFIKNVGKRMINGRSHDIWKVITPEKPADPGQQARMNF